MWLSEQQKRPVDPDEGQTGVVTIGGTRPAVQLDSERRGLEVYSPAGYRWTPQAGQRVLVIKNRGEDPCVVGAELEGDAPHRVEICADEIDLQGQVLINGIPLETYIAMIMGGA